MTSSRRMLALVGLLLLCAPGTAASRAVGAVSGQLTLLERAGAARKDLATSVVFLQPLDGRDDGLPGNVPTEATIAMRGREFIPHVAIVRRGGVVKFPNQDPFSHNVFSNTAPTVFDLGLYRRGATRETRFADDGVYAIYCNIHARMVSYVIAVPGRYVTQALSDGRFTIADVPTGTYRLVVWHERAGLVSREIVVSGSGAAVALTLDARGYVPGPHLNKFGMPYATTRSDRY